MQQASTTQRSILNEMASTPFGILRNYLLNPLKAGLFGFAVYFSFLIAVKYTGLITGSRDFFTVDILDVALSGLGFLLFSLIKLVGNFSKEEDFKKTGRDKKAAF